MSQVVIPNKLFFRIGEVAELAQVEPYVLRYWETEFALRPSKSKRKQRLYQRKDIESILRIKKLLYEERYTIAGAKKRLKELKKLKENEQLTLISPDANPPKLSTGSTISSGTPSDSALLNHATVGAMELSSDLIRFIKQDLIDLRRSLLEGK